MLLSVMRVIIRRTALNVMGPIATLNMKNTVMATAVRLPSNIMVACCTSWPYGYVVLWSAGSDSIMRLKNHAWGWRARHFLGRTVER